MAEIDAGSAPRRGQAAGAPSDPNAQLLIQLVDGRNTVEDIALLIGVDLSRVLELVAALHSQGFLEFPAPAPTGDLPAQTRRLVDELWSDLGRLDAIALLGCSQTPSLEEVRQAYAERARLLDPKRQSGELGAYAEKLPRVYQRVTQGYQVLATQLERRAQAQAQAQAQAAGARGRGVSSSARAAAPAAPPSQARIRAARRDSGQPGAPASQARLQALRRRLSDPAMQRSSGVMAATASPQRGPQVEQYVRMAEAAISADDLSSAVNTLKIALTIAPEDAELRARHREIETKLATSNADEYLSRARAAERDCDDLRAASWYEKASLGRPNDIKLKVSAVTALLRAGTEPKRAVTLAKSAVLLAPCDVETRLALARAYIAAGAKRSAEGELRKVLELDKGNGSAKSLLKKV